MAKQTAVLKDVELFWAKLDPKNPAAPFGKKVWEVQVRTTDKTKSQELKKIGLNVKMDENDNGTFYKVGLKRRALFEKTGDPNQPVICVDGQMAPLDGTTIGNGSVGNVQVELRDYEFNGQKGTSIELKAIQVTKLVEYTGGANAGLAFEEVGQTEVVSGGSASVEAIEEDLY